MIIAGVGGYVPPHRIDEVLATQPRVRFHLEGGKVFISVRADRTNVITRPATDAHRAEYPAEWAAYEAEQSRLVYTPEEFEAAVQAEVERRLAADAPKRRGRPAKE